jgi:hypothetical protein
MLGLTDILVLLVSKYTDLMSETRYVLLQEGDLFWLEFVLLAQLVVLSRLKEALRLVHLKVLLEIKVKVAAQGKIESGYKELFDCVLYLQTM